MINYLKRDLRKCSEIPVIIQPNHDVINKESLNLYHVIIGNYDYHFLWTLDNNDVAVVTLLCVLM